MPGNTPLEADDWIDINLHDAVDEEAIFGTCPGGKALAQVRGRLMVFLCSPECTRPIPLSP
jgi:hypothetical protein